MVRRLECSVRKNHTLQQCGGYRRLETLCFCHARAKSAGVIRNRSDLAKRWNDMIVPAEEVLLSLIRERRTPMTDDSSRASCNACEFLNRRPSRSKWLWSAMPQRGSVRSPSTPAPCRSKSVASFSTAIQAVQPSRISGPHRRSQEIAKGLWRHHRA